MASLSCSLPVLHLVYLVLHHLAALDVLGLVLVALDAPQRSHPAALDLLLI